ncbi:helix-turn-helix domain-containing protein [Hymenobacter actinosclerus]|uniref:DNA-binding transcriptional regulator, XRE-family HTH domain n=1 Tax=Hymenobacter actinosclerus TaxID=82805 RepID=A0A1I0DID5_9BACT|nr:helix-turn-helix transcriptional regulator [Hymenobacter actinosclerus]SET32187.1 DNA-binding transcriptional regulator, XRE-family HTH domain [Hymenobacter actinosclerus]
MLDRIQELLQVRELSASQFADAIGVSRPVMSHILSGRNKPSLEVVQKIIAAFPDLSISWLLNGAGPMLERPAAAAAVKAGVAPVSAIPATSASLTAVTPAAAAPVAAPAQPAISEPAAVVASAPTVAPVATPTPPASPPEPIEPLKPASQPRVAAAPVSSPAAAAPAGADLAYALAEPGKTIRRIVLFYQDGTFADFRPENGA